MQALEIWAWRSIFRITWTQRKRFRYKVGVNIDENLLRSMKRNNVVKCGNWNRLRESLVGELPGKNEEIVEQRDGLT